MQNRRTKLACIPCAFYFVSSAWNGHNFSTATLRYCTMRINDRLVARFAIVTKILQIILNPCVVWKVHYCGKKSWETIFCPTKKCKKIWIFFWEKHIACLPVPKESDSSFTIAANFSRADPGAKRRKKSLLQKQLRSSKSKPFPEESDRLLNPYIPLLKNSFSTNFQGTGPWEGPVHFSRFVLTVNNCSKLFQSWSWVHLPLPLPLPLLLPLPLALCSSSCSSSSSCFSSSSPVPLPLFLSFLLFLLLLPLSLSLSLSLLSFPFSSSFSFSC